MITYNLGIPDGPHNPSTDQPDMKENNDNIAQFVAVDHVGFNVATGPNNSGYHTIIHETVGGRARSGAGATFTNFPAAIPNINQIFTALYTPQYSGGPGPADTQLFNVTGGGGISQLTGNNVVPNGGWCWIGGILVIWGLQSTAGTTGTVTFTSLTASTISFPNNIFGVIATQQGTAFVGQSQTIVIGAYSQTSFQWSQTISGTNRPANFFWLAYGN